MRQGRGGRGLMRDDHDPRYGGVGRVGGVSDALVKRRDSTTLPRTAQAPRITDPAFRRQVDRLHALGARALGEALLEISLDSSAPDVVAHATDRFAALDPAMLQQLGGDQWPAMPLREVAR